MTLPDLRLAAEKATGLPVASTRPLYGGCVARVCLIEFADGRRVVAKHDPSPNATLDIEARMLQTLDATGLVPVPAVLAAEPGFLLIDHVENDGTRSDPGDRRLAEILATLHARPAETFGFHIDTPIGGLIQINTPCDSWPRFFAEKRILDFARRAHARGALPQGMLERLKRIADDAERLIDPPPDHPALIHGDAWSGNVLWNRGQPVALIDPAVYNADPEIELAFIDLMGNVGSAFWERYAEVGLIRPGFWERRKDFYNLYPLLVHAVLFRGGYGNAAERTLASLGY